jgi:hypothetical protein
MEDNKPELKDSIFEKIMPLLDDYQLCKLKLQQLRHSSNYSIGVDQELTHNIKFYAGKIKEIITQDAENQ